MPHQQFIVVTMYNIFCFDINIIHKVILDFVLLNKYSFPYPCIKVVSGLTDQTHYIMRECCGRLVLVTCHITLTCDCDPDLISSRDYQASASGRPTLHLHSLRVTTTTTRGLGLSGVSWSRHHTSGREESVSLGLAPREEVKERYAENMEPERRREFLERFPPLKNVEGGLYRKRVMLREREEQRKRLAEITSQYTPTFAPVFSH